MAKTKAKPKAAPKAKAKSASPKTHPKGKVEPYKFDKLDRLTRSHLIKMDVCHDGLVWWDKVFKRGGAMELKVEAVPLWFEGYIPATSFDMLWSAWLLRQLIEKLVDQMDLNYSRYGAECKRMYAVHKAFEREASKADREHRLANVDQRTRVTACIALVQTMIVTYRKL